MTDRVSAQYEAYPYPQRLPQDDKSRLIEGSPSHLKEVDHYVFGGRLIAGERRERGPLRVLVAGGGPATPPTCLGHTPPVRICPAASPFSVFSARSAALSRRAASGR